MAEDASLDSGAAVARIMDVFSDAPRLHLVDSLRPQLTRAIARFAKTLTWVLRLRGKHYSGLSNQELFDILAAQGRDFGADTRSLREHVEEKLMDEYADSDTIPLAIDFEVAAADAILEWIVMRFDGAARDVRLDPLSSDYAAYKRREGLSSRIGVAKGDLMDSVENQGSVRVRRR